MKAGVSGGKGASIFLKMSNTVIPSLRKHSMIPLPNVLKEDQSSEARFIVFYTRLVLSV